MAYNIGIRVKNVKDIQALANVIAQIVESATGQRAIVNIQDTRALVTKQDLQKKNIFKKLSR